VPKYFKYFFVFYTFLPLLILNFMMFDQQQFVYLAKAFLEGSTSLTTLPPTNHDLSFFEGKYFWPLGPFPAIILVPFVSIFKLNFTQGFIQLPLTIFNFWLIIKIAKTQNLESKKALFLAIFFIFGSIYTPLAALALSWNFAQVVATTCLLFALFEFFTNRRWFLIGLAIAFATLTRAHLIVASVFFITYLLQKPTNTKRIITFIIPILLSLVILAIYNYTRFGSIFESGYKYQLVPEESAKRRGLGIISPAHIPANLYYMLIKTPDPVFENSSHVLKPPYIRFDPYGMSIFLMSPILFLIFLTNFKDKYVKTSLFTITVLLIPITTYYGIGYIQVGYRYALDFFPFLLVPLISVFKKTSINLIKILVILGIFISWFFTIEKIVGY